MLDVCIVLQPNEMKEYHPHWPSNVWGAVKRRGKTTSFFAGTIMEIPDFAAGLGVWPYFPGLPVPEISVDEEAALIRHLEQQSLFQMALERMDSCEHERNTLDFSDILLD